MLAITSFPLPYMLPYARACLLTTQSRHHHQQRQQQPPPPPESGAAETKRLFAELLPKFPFEDMFSPSVASTLAHIYGYER